MHDLLERLLEDIRSNSLVGVDVSEINTMLCVQTSDDLGIGTNFEGKSGLKINLTEWSKNAKNASASSVRVCAMIYLENSKAHGMVVYIVCGRS